MSDQAIILRQLMQSATRRQTMVSSWGVLGAKGGVGTTSVAIALALESARLGFRTLLIDTTTTDDIANVLRQRPSCGWTQAVLNPELWDTAIFPILPRLEILSEREPRRKYSDSFIYPDVAMGMATERGCEPTRIRSCLSSASSIDESSFNMLRATSITRDGIPSTQAIQMAQRVHTSQPSQTMQTESVDDRSANGCDAVAFPLHVASSQCVDETLLVESKSWFQRQGGCSQLPSQLLSALDELSVASHVSSEVRPSFAESNVFTEREISEVVDNTSVEMRASRFRWDRIVLDLGCRREQDVSVMEQAATRLIPVTTTHSGSLESCGEIVARYRREGLTNRVDVLFNQTSASDFAVAQSRLIRWCQMCAGCVPRIVGTLPYDPRWESDLLSNVWSNSEKRSAEGTSEARRACRSPWHFLRRYRPTMATAIENVVLRLLASPEASDFDIDERNRNEAVENSFVEDKKKFAVPDVSRKVA